MDVNVDNEEEEESEGLGGLRTAKRSVTALDCTGDLTGLTLAGQSTSQ